MLPSTSLKVMLITAVESVTLAVAPKTVAFGTGGVSLCKTFTLTLSLTAGAYLSFPSKDTTIV